MSKQTRVSLTEGQMEALSYALDLAYDDQEHYAKYANVDMDYGDEWPEVRAGKQEQFRAIGEIEKKLFGGSSRWEELAESLEEE